MKRMQMSNECIERIEHIARAYAHANVKKSFEKDALYTISENGFHVKDNVLPRFKKSSTSKFTTLMLMLEPSPSMTVPCHDTGLHITVAKFLPSDSTFVDSLLVEMTNRLTNLRQGKIVFFGYINRNCSLVVEHKKSSSLAIEILDIVKTMRKRLLARKELKAVSLPDHISLGIQNTKGLVDSYLSCLSSAKADEQPTAQLDKQPDAQLFDQQYVQVQQFVPFGQQFVPFGQQFVPFGQQFVPYSLFDQVFVPHVSSGQAFNPSNTSSSCAQLQDNVIRVPKQRHRRSRAKH